MGLSAEGGDGNRRGGRELSCHMESSLCGGRGVLDGGEQQHAFTSEHLHCAVSLCLRIVFSVKPPQARVRPTNRTAQVPSAQRRYPHRLAISNLNRRWPNDSLGPSLSRSGQFHAHVTRYKLQTHQTNGMVHVCSLEPSPCWSCSKWLVRPALLLLHE